MSGNECARGFTLLEVVAALVLLGAGSAILYAGYAQANRLEERAAERELASILARMKLAQLEAGEETGCGGEYPELPGYRWTAEYAAPEEAGVSRLTVAVEGGRGRAVAVWTWVGRAP